MTTLALAQSRGGRRRAQPEHVEQVLFFKRVAVDHRLSGVLMTAIPNGGFRHKATAAKLKAEGVVPGVPDILVFQPSVLQPAVAGGQYVQYVGLAIEMKVKPNKPTPAQLAWHVNLRARGWSVAVCYSAEEAYDTLLRYLGHST